MAMSCLAARSNWDLTCGVCQDIYRSPRFLPCHHSFCLMCIEGLARTHGQRFMCPQCRKQVQVPPDGPLAFPVNFYFKEEQLELARKGPGNTICPTHAKDMEPLVFFCTPCDKAVCIRCKLTKHENHKTEDLSEAAEKCIKPLEDSKLRLDKTIAILSKKSLQAQEDLAATKVKSKLLKEQVKHQRDLLMARTDKLMKSVLEKVEETNLETEKHLETRVSSIQKNLDSMTQLRQRVHHALEGDHADKVCAEREMRTGAGTMQMLKAAIDSIPESTLRPVLLGQTNIADDTILQLLGKPMTVTIKGQISMEVITPVVQLEKDNPCRRVHSLFFLDGEIFASFGGMPTTYCDADIYCIVPGKSKTTSEKVNNQVGKCTLQMRSEKKAFYSTYMSSDCLKIVAKGRAMFKAVFSRQSGNCLVYSKVPTMSAEDEVTFIKTDASMITGTMLAFDAQKSGDKFVLIEERAKRKRLKAKRTVKLYSPCKKEPLAIYQPPEQHFLPMDVCFWHHEDDDMLLIADWHNDRIHVVDTTDNQLQFVRYLAEGSGHLARPTALNVDEKGFVWIGCNNGWILRCENVCPEEESIAEDSELTECMSELMVANGSQATEEE